ncbi:MAG: hypothetical protein UX17_C0040G0006 [Parcubacteria group bacterium GW2011_GWC2_45_7]|nr:MAG: hypothetical protein UX17_C0040G0006 [Parcubacteria group bacterium GW2011_GWC2_45_7]
MLFYLSVSVALLGTCMLLGIILHHIRFRLAASKAEILTIAREATLVVAFTIIILNLAAYKLLKWWNILPLALLILTAELFFISLDKRPRRNVKHTLDESGALEN